MQAKLFTKAEMDRELAITEVIKDYNAEINWWLENKKTKKFFGLLDPSEAFITAKQKRDFNELYPVRLSLPYLHY